MGFQYGSDENNVFALVGFQRMGHCQTIWLYLNDNKYHSCNILRAVLEIPGEQ